MPEFRDKTSWYIGLAAYWFASSAKWFILLLLILPEQVKVITHDDAKNTAWGLVVSVGSIWAIFGPAIFGFVSDRIGFKRTPFIAIGAGMTVIAFMFLASANQMWMMFVGYLMLQVSDDVAQGSYQALIPELVPEDRRGRASGVMASFDLLAQITIAVIGLALGLNAQLVYIALAVINIAGAIATIRTVKGAKPLVHVEAEVAGSAIGAFFMGWVLPWRSRDFAWVWATRFLNSLGFYLILLYLSNYLSDVVKTFDLGFVTVPSKYGVMAIGLVISLFGGLGALWASKVVDRIGRKKVVFLSGLLMSVLLVPFALVPVYGVILLLSIGFGIGYGAYLGSSWALISDVLPSAKAIATDMGVWAMSLTLGQMIAGFAGRFVDQLNSNQFGMGYTASFLTGAVMFFLGTVFVRKIKGST
jgi:MFS family permease